MANGETGSQQGICPWGRMDEWVLEAESRAMAQSLDAKDGCLSRAPGPQVGQEEPAEESAIDRMPGVPPKATC